jgi:hypothetical protein
MRDAESKNYWARKQRVANVKGALTMIALAACVCIFLISTIARG